MAVGAVIGRAVFSALLKVFFDKLASPAIKDFFHKLKLEEELESLSATFRNVTVFLAYAEEKLYDNDVVKMWLDEIKDAVYDAEDLMDELEMKLEKKRREGVRLLFNSVSGRFKQSFKSRILEFSRRFDRLAKDIFDHRLDKFATGTWRPSETRETTSWGNESRIYGRSENKREIVKLLLENKPSHDNVFSVISIVGMAGVGKTTLAQIVYNDELVTEHFDIKVWVYVSDQFDVKRITKSILKSITQATYDSPELSVLDAFNFRRITRSSLELVALEMSDSFDLSHHQLKLRNKLKAKKFLMVFDDVWHEQYGDWDLLQKPFRVGAVGSKIVVTSRNHEVATMMGPISIHHLMPLCDTHCWSVFKEHAYVERSIDPESASLKKKVARKSKGLPLAAKILGRLLRSTNESEWENILKNDIWDIPGENGILPVLRLSYHYLPLHLRRCFAYCAILPVDYEFGEEELVLLWMAEGFLGHPTGKMVMEDYGHKCFRELLSRSFFQPSISNESLFVMHPLMSDLAQWVAGQTCLRLEDLPYNSEQFGFSGKLRHSSYNMNWSEGIKRFENFHELGTLRTFLPLKGVAAHDRTRYLTSYVTNTLLPKLKCLRVLSFSGFSISELPKSIPKMKHLRYLNLSNSEIKSLPEEICTMHNLQTLLLGKCLQLEKLPKDLGALINLRHLDITDSKVEAMPPKVSRLTSLQKLSDFVVGKYCTSGIGELMNLEHLKDSLRISHLNNVTDDKEALNANLSGKKYLEGLTLSWGGKITNRRNHELEEKVLHLLHPHEKLKELIVMNYCGSSFPTWIGDRSFSKMVVIKLENCERCKTLPPLGQLLSLKDVHIKGMTEVENISGELYGDNCSASFPSLESLCFENMRKWKSWLHTVDGSFPLLRNLTINNCPKLLESLPPHLPSLKKLVVRRSQKLTVKLSGLPSLCELETNECQKVVDGRELVHLNILKLGNVSEATFITEGSISELTQVQQLEILGGDALGSLLQREVGLLTNFASLCRLFVKCDNLQNLGALDCLTCLEELSIVECPILESFAESGFSSILKKLTIDGCHSLTSVARAPLFSTVKELEIASCRNLQSLLIEDEASSSMSDSSNCCIPILKALIVKDCSSLTSLSSATAGLPSTLEHLQISRCPKLESIGETWHDNTSLCSIDIELCQRFKSLPKGLHDLTRLSVLKLYDCKSFTSFQDEGLPAANLKQFEVSNCVGLNALPKNMHKLTTLRELTIDNCPGITSFPRGGFPTNLTALVVRDLKICQAMFEWGLDRLTFLRKFEIKGGCPDMESFPSEDRRKMLPTTLIDLSIKDFPKLQKLSSGFQSFKSLETVWLQDCPNLKHTEEYYPPSLLRLDIHNCPLLVRAEEV